MSQYALQSTEYDPLTAEMIGSGKDKRTRLGRFIEFQSNQDQVWYTPDLATWRDSLLEENLSPATISAYLSTVRGAYQAILRDNRTRDALYAMTPPDASPADKQAIVNEVLVRMENAIRPGAAPVRQITKQDVTDTEHLRLSPAQAERLMDMPDTGTLSGLRDLAVIGLLLCTGIRRDELCQLEVSDLRQESGDELVLLVREGKGDKQRVVPYGEYEWILDVVDAWRLSARIEEGPVFRSINRWDGVSDKPLSGRSVDRILERYPISIRGEWRTVEAHDCRRTYARQMYDSGMDLVAIQQNLGHADIKTTMGYIGELDMQRRRGRSAIRYSTYRLYQQHVLPGMDQED